jgi:hypothetical protein
MTIPSNHALEIPLAHQEKQNSSPYTFRMPQNTPTAKTNPRCDIDVRKYVAVAMRQAPTNGSLRLALMQRLLTDRTLADIAAENSCTIAKLEYWVIKLRFPRRKRGRRVRRAPSVDDKQVIDLFRRYGAAETARLATKSRPRIYQILSRWAPELKRPWHRRDGAHEQPPKRHAAQSEVIAFRLTPDELRALEATRPKSSLSDFSVNKWARELVRHFIATPAGNGREVGHNSASSALITPNDKIIDFVGQNTA